MRKTSKTVREPKHNHQYDQNERKIQKAILDLLGPYLGRITARQVARAAGLSRQTIYNHHTSINRAIVESEEIMLEEFIAALDGQSGKLANIVSDANGRLFYALLIFMAQHREVFCPVCADVGNQGVLYRMLETLYPRLRIDWLPKGSPTPAIGSERADMLIRMAAEVICKWGMATGCDVRKAGRYIGRLLRVLSDAAKNRIP